MGMGASPGLGGGGEEAEEDGEGTADGDGVGGAGAAPAALGRRWEPGSIRDALRDISARTAGLSADVEAMG